jgi:hypothetical protein
LSTATIVALLLGGSLALAAPKEEPPKKPAVKDEGTGLTFTVQADDRTLVATDAAGMTVWQVDVIGSAGPAPRGSTAVGGESFRRRRRLLLLDDRLEFRSGLVKRFT